MRFLAVVLALGLGACTSPGDRVPPDLAGRLTVFALAGQSNMVGYAPLPEEQAPTPRAYLFGNDYRWRPALEPTDDPADQVDRVSRDEKPGTSPGVAFARALLEARPDLAVGLVPCARGGTTLLEWSRAPGADSLYGSCLKRIAATSPMGRLGGILFFQGEADAARSADGYGARFEQLVEDLRRDLGRPRLPIVFAQIGGTTMPEAFPHWREVQEQQAAAALRLPCVAMIQTGDLSLQDNVHFTTGSYQEIGRRFARAYLELITNPECD